MKSIGYTAILSYKWIAANDGMLHNQGSAVKHSEFKKWLAKQGCTFSPQGKGGHITVHYQGRKTVMPYHASKEIGAGLVKAIKKQLGIED